MLETYQNATQAYADEVEELRRHMGTMDKPEYETLYRMTEELRLGATGAREELNAHVRLHGCLTTHNTPQIDIVLTGSAVLICRRDKGGRSGQGWRNHRQASRQRRDIATREDIQIADDHGYIRSMNP